MQTLEEIQTLFEDTSQSSYRRRDALGEACAMASESSVASDFIIRQFKHIETSWRRDLLQLLRRNKCYLFADAAAEALSEESDESVRRELLDYLSQAGSLQHCHLIETLCESDSYSISYAAKRALGAIKRRVPEVVVEAPVASNSVKVGSEKAIEEGVVIESTSELKLENTQEKIQSRDSELKPQAGSSEFNIEISKGISADTSDLIVDLLPLKEVDWNKALQMKKFYRNKFENVREIYIELYEVQSQMPVLENKIAEALTELTLQRADKDDDIKTILDKVQRSEEALREAKSKRREVEKKLSGKLSDADSMVNKLFTAFSSERQLRQDEEKKLLEQEIDRHLKDAEKYVKRIEQLGQEHRLLLEPIEELEKVCQESELSKKTLLKTADSLSRQLDNCFMEALPSAQDFKGCRLFTITQSRLQNALGEKEQLVDEKNLIEEALDKASVMRTDNLDALNKAVADGFECQTVERDLTVRLNALIQFSEEKGFFGFSNASGTASGSGHVRGKYKVEEVSWHKRIGLASSVTEFSNGWSENGRLQANLELLQIREGQLQKRINEYCRFMRSELEKELNS